MIYRFGLFEFDPVSGELRKQGRLVRIEPQPARALTLLVGHPGEVISRDRLRAHVWEAGTHVDYDRGLAYCIGQVRTALGDSADNPRFIETLPRRGYRFLAPVQVSGTGAPTAPAAWSPSEAGAAGAPSTIPGVAHSATPEPPAAVTSGTAPSPPGVAANAPRSRGPWWSLALLVIAVTSGMAWTTWGRMSSSRPLVAVAIFDNETGHREFDRLAATAADVVVERLTALGTERIGVIGNTPTLRLPRGQRDPAAVQHETGAEYFVFGQVQDDDAGVRLVVHLIRLDDDTHLWVTRVARARSDLSDIQDVVADRLAEAVRRHVIEHDPDAPRFTR